MLIRVLVSICALAALAFPQAFTSNLTGVVSDPNQAVVPGATAKLVNKSTQ